MLRIVLLGGESSGKSSLAARLAGHFDSVWVPEYGRELWERQSGVLSEADLLTIAEIQSAREDAAASDARDYLFCDTSPLTTAGYGLWMFGRIDPALAVLAQRRYDGVILCQPDFPFVQDGGRFGEAFRLQQHEWYVAQLRQLDTPTLSVHGSVDARVAQVERWLPTLASN